MRARAFTARSRQRTPSGPFLSKISPPLLLPALLRRTRLLRQIDAATAAASLVWVAAPPGAGKTTLMASWLARKRRPWLWDQLDEGDGDTAALFHYLGLRSGRALPRITPEASAAAGPFARRWFRELWAGLGRGAVIVFDDVHMLPPGSPSEVALAEGLCEIPRGNLVVLASRRPPPPAFARHLVNAAMATIGPRELRLTVEESRELARIHQVHDPGVVERLQSASEGWVAGMALLLRARAAEARPAQGVQPLLDYFAAEVFGRADHDTQRVLLETAPIPELTGEMANAVTGLPGAGRILEALARQGYFVTSHGSAPPTFRYHALFRGFLLAHGAVHVTPERRRAIALEAAGLLERDGHPEAAIEMLRQAGDPRGEIRRVALRHAADMLATGRIATLQQWLELVPRQDVEGDPWSLHWLGLTTFHSQPERGQQLLERAFDRARQSDDPSGQYAMWAAAAGSFLYHFDGGEPFARWLSRWDELRLRLPLPPPVQAIIAPTVLMLMVFGRPAHPELREWEERCLEIARTGAAPDLRARAALALILGRFYSGRHSRMAEVITALGDVARTSQDPDVRLTWHACNGYFLMCGMGSPREGQAEFERGLELARQDGAAYFRHVLAINGSWAAQEAGDFEAARRLLAEAGSVGPRSRWLALGEACWSAAVALHDGDRREALARARAAEALAREATLEVPTNLANGILVRTLLEAGEVSEASVLLGRMRRAGAAAGSAYAEYACQLLEALCALRRGTAGEALVPLAEAAAIGAAHGIFVPPLGGAGVTAELCAAALELGAGVSYFREVIARQGLPPPPHAEVLESWPRAVQVRTLGGFAVTGASDHIPRRERELLQAAIALGSASVRVESIIDALWPDADGDRSRHAFESTLHRLRAHLGCAKALVLRDGTMSIDPRHCWVDAWALERRLDQGSRTPADARAALALYRGAFLPGSPEAWAELGRDRLRRKLRRYLDGPSMPTPAGAGPSIFRERCLEVDPGLAGPWAPAS